MSLIPEITAEQIDDWFRLGKKSVKVHSIPKSKSRGQYLDPETLQPTQLLPTNQHVPNYKRRPDFHGGQEYAAGYQMEEEEKLINRSVNAESVRDDVSVMSSQIEALEMDTTIAGSAVLPADMAPENALHVYQQYDFTPTCDEHLPIAPFREQVTATVESNQVTVIQGSTGSGKTTQVPQFILDHFASQNKYCNIIVTQPRRIAAMSIARRVCQERGWELGTVCGYQVGLDKVANEDTRLLYCTTGILLNKLIGEKNMHQYTHVILDEVHERDQDTDFSLLVVRKLLRTNSQYTRVVLMSATFDSNQFARYFALPILDRLEQAPVVNVDGTKFSVREYYAEDLTQLGELPPLDENSPDLSPEAQHLAVRLMGTFDQIEIKEQGSFQQTGMAQIRGTVLVFLPGLGEITALEQELSKLERNYKLKIIPLHSSITIEEQRRVFDMPMTGERKVILSTNIAESSITVPDIKYVIDFCLTKNLVCDFDTNYTSLQVHWASKANCTQRKGRAGRVSNGRVYRLVTRDFYQKQLSEYSLPEMQRCPLDKLILKVKVLDLGEPKAILALALSPPNLDDIERNILTLKEVGALTTATEGYGNRHDGQLTFVGRVLADLPVDTKIGKLLVLGHVFGLLQECLIIGAAMSLKSMFSQPFKERLNAYRRKLAWADGSQSDSLAILIAYQVWQKKKERGEFKRSGGGGELGWGKHNYLQIRRLKEIAELVKELEKRLANFNMLVPKTEPHYKGSEDEERLLLKVVLCGAFYPNYFVRSEIDEQESIKFLSGRNPLNTVMVKGLPANQGTLYKQVIEDMFRKCENNPKAYFEETRAYIEFPWKSKRSAVHQGVYMALKMKQLRMPLFVELFSPEDAHAMLRNLQDAQSRQAEGGHLRTNRLTVSSGSAAGQDDGSVGVQVDLPDPSREVITISVTDVIECGHFWAQYSEESNYRELVEIHETLNREGGRYLRPLSSRARVGSLCVAPYQDEVMEYYRGKVMSVENRFDPQLGRHREIVEVFFVDFGNTSEVMKDDLRELPQNMVCVPFQAFECRLIKIRPSPIKCPDGKWTEEATGAFKHMVFGQQRIIAQPYSVVHGVLHLELVNADHRGQFHIAQRLIEMGYADEAEENFLSNQNHDQRCSQYVALKNQGTKKLPVVDKKPDWLSVSLGQVGSSKKGSRINLNGPDNPNEMRFFGMTNIARLKSTKIEQESVNSVAIDDSPHDSHQRLMVAGFVGLNPSLSSIITRDTTIMPHVPGLAALMVLLFTPVAEFRVNKDKSRLIGAICGLGTDPVDGYSVLPDHDIELPFDVKIDLEDITRINGVRLAINIAVGNKDSVAGWGVDAVYKLQQRARKKLLDLIQRRRDKCDIEFPQVMYEWNQLDPEDLLDPGDVVSQDCPMLLNLHSGVDLPEEGDRELNYYLQHLQMLRKVVKDNTKRGPTLCELCKVTCPKPQLLALHLETQMHKRREEELIGVQSSSGAQQTTSESCTQQATSRPRNQPGASRDTSRTGNQWAQRTRNHGDSRFTNQQGAFRGGHQQGRQRAGAWEVAPRFRNQQGDPRNMSRNRQMGYGSVEDRHMGSGAYGGRQVGHGGDVARQQYPREQYTSMEGAAWYGDYNAEEIYRRN